MKNILIVEDEKNIAELLTYNLEKEKYRVDWGEDGNRGWNLFESKRYDLIILDLMLPKLSGLDLCTKIRKLDGDVPIIMLTAKSTEEDKVRGLNIGADDYITKPFSIVELLARINVIFRRLDRENRKKSRTLGRLTIDFDSYLVFKDDKEVDLTLKEFELLRLLLEHEGEVLSRDRILEEVWGYDFTGETRTVDVHIRTLRTKIELDPREPEYIKTVRGVGYRFGMV